jgi:hypothetical protein
VISSLLLVLGAGVLSVALRGVPNQVCFRLGTFGFVGTSLLAGWLLGGSLALGIVFALSWFFLPWLEILTRVRRLRLPMVRRLEKCAPPTARYFPNLDSLSGGIEELGFEYVEDVDWKHDGMRQFFRLFQSTNSRYAAAVCFVEQDVLNFYYVTYISRTNEGRLLMTWNYPFSYGMHLPPRVRLQKIDEQSDVAQLFDEHTVFVEAESVGDDLRPIDPLLIREELENDLRLQIEHNLDRGILKREGPETIRYSVRGMFYLWGEFLREFIRFS